MRDKTVLIVGYGVVGHNLAEELSVLKPDIYDKYKKDVSTKKDMRYDFAFICVDTPFVSKDNACDTTEVINAINETDADIIILKSTVPIGFTSMMANRTGRPIIFSPEFYGGTQHCNNFNFDFTVLGGARPYCKKVAQLLLDVYDARHQFKMVNSDTAEMLKYMDNSWLATKVSFCTSFWKMCQSGDYAVDYEELRELFILDPRVNPAHTFVYDNHPYWDSHCLNKDVPAVATMGNDLMMHIWEENEKDKKLYKEN